jgi:glutamyl-tRNA synthetase
MHIGNLRTALYTYLIARKHGGKFLLRIEDTDQNRYVADAVDVIYNVMRACGLRHDEGPDVGGPVGPYVQSERRGIYREYAEKLVTVGGAFHCFCTAERLAEVKTKCEAEGHPFRYDGHCKRLAADEVRARLSRGETHVVRQVVPATGITSFDDHVYGHIEVDNATLEEGILLKSDGLPTYNFANVIDDHLMGITHVVRGNEYLSSTPKYNLIYKAFGWEVPQYVHCPPILRAAGKKLSKRDGDASFEDFRGKGYLTEAILNYIALLGWGAPNDREFFTLAELEQAFTIENISKSPAIFDAVKLRAFNAHYMRQLSPERFHELAEPFYPQALREAGINLARLSKSIQSRTEVLSEVGQMTAFLTTLPEYSPELFVNKKAKTDKDVAKRNLATLRARLADLTTWTHESLEAATAELVASTGQKTSQFLWPLRVAVTGTEVTPGGGIEFAELLGKEETLRRIDKAL